VPQPGLVDFETLLKERREGCPHFAEAAPLISAPPIVACLQTRCD
jgi:hypothetical protein